MVFEAPGRSNVHVWSSRVVVCEPRRPGLVGPPGIEILGSPGGGRSWGRAALGVSGGSPVGLRWVSGGSPVGLGTPLPF